ncbi:MAG: c-type cytochrome [Terriglobia bacterium]
MHPCRQPDDPGGIPSFISGYTSPFLAGAGVLILWLCLAVPVLTSTAARNTAPAKDSATQGKQGFVSNCGVCHGLDGRGGEHAPNIATNPIVQNLSEAELERIVGKGIPAQGMPSFSALGPARIKTVVEYLRVLQGKQSAVVIHGNPTHGRELFFGGAQCSNCHMIQGQGGFLGADLTKYSLTHSFREIREAIVDPNKNLRPQAETVVAVTRDGQQLIGIVRNEDNFSVQLQTTDGSFHLLMKSDLRELQHRPESLMPSGYGSKLSASDLNDLISFLVKTGETAAAAQESTQNESR